MQEWVNMTTKANEIKTLNIPQNRLKISQLKCLLKPLKRDNDPPMPSKKQDIIDLFKKWSTRQYTPKLESELVTNCHKCFEDEVCVIEQV